MTLEKLLDDLKCGVPGVAAAVNGEIIPHHTFSMTTIHTGDQVEIVRAVSGG